MTTEIFPIEVGHVMTFARAIGDANPLYYDDGLTTGTETQGVLAPPTFVIADVQYDPTPSPRIRPQSGVTWLGSGRMFTYPQKTSTDSSHATKTAEVSRGTRLHAEEHFEYLRPLRVGDVLTKNSRAGDTWERRGRRGGTLRFSEQIHEYRDQEGNLVVSARQVSVQTERVVENM